MLNNKKIEKGIMKNLFPLGLVGMMFINTNTSATSIEDKVKETLDASKLIKSSITDAKSVTNELSEQINVFDQSGASVAVPFQKNINILLSKVEKKQDEIEAYILEMTESASTIEIKTISTLPAQLDRLEDEAQMEAFRIQDAVLIGDIETANVGIANLKSILAQMKVINNQIKVLTKQLKSKVKEEAQAKKTLDSSLSES